MERSVKGEEGAPWRGVAGVMRWLHGEECRDIEGAPWRGV